MTLSSSAMSREGFTRPRLLSEHVYEQLRELIVTNQLAPDEALVEEKLAQQWSISRTPLRSALDRLEREGLVRRSPHRGAFVSPLRPPDVENVYQVRAALEVMAIELATPYIPDSVLADVDDQFRRIEADLTNGNYDSYIPSDAMFHSFYLPYVPNPLLVQSLERIFDQVNRIRNHSNTHPGDNMRQSFAEHQAILAALRRRDAEGAASAMRTHLRNVIPRTLELLPTYRSEGG